MNDGEKSGGEIAFGCDGSCCALDADDAFVDQAEDRPEPLIPELSVAATFG